MPIHAAGFLLRLVPGVCGVGVVLAVAGACQPSLEEWGPVREDTDLAQCGRFEDARPIAPDSSVYVERARVWFDPATGQPALVAGRPVLVIPRPLTKAGPSQSLADSMRRAVGVVRTSDGTWAPVAVPEALGASDTALNNAVIEFGEDGTLHLFWMRVRYGPLTGTDTVFHAEFRSGQWSDRNIVLAAPAVAWHEFTRSAYVRADTVMLVVHHMRSPSGFHLVQGVRQPGNHTPGGWVWSSTEVGIPFFVTAVALGAGFGGDLTVGLLGLPPGALGDTTAVYVTRSTGGRDSWGPIHEIARGGGAGRQHQYPEFRTFLTGDQAFVWVVRGAGSSDSIEVYAHSRDVPDGWKHLASRAGGGLVQGISTAVSGDGVLHAVLWPLGKALLHLAFDRDRSLVVEDRPISGESLSRPTLSTRTDGSLFLTWGKLAVLRGIEGVADSVVLPYLMTARLVPCPTDLTPRLGQRSEPGEGPNPTWGFP